MAKRSKAEPAAPPVPEFTEKDQNRARQWFKKAEDLRERRDYDYAIECYIKGLDFWPEAVEDGHMPLRSLALQRQQAGGKKPGLMDGMKLSMSGKDPKKAMLNAETLLAKDPGNTSYAEGLLRNANKAGFLETCKWIAPIVAETLKKDKKLNKSRFSSFREAMIEAAEKADARGDNVLETWLLEQAVQSLEFIASRNPTDEGLRNELRNLSGKLTIARGKYDEDGDFRDSLQDADKQKLLHDSERMRQSDDTYEALLEARRREWQEDPTTSAKINALVDVLLKSEREKEENEALDVLNQVYGQTKNYSFKQRADDVRMRQLQRRANALIARARETGAEEDKQQARLAAQELRQLMVEVFRERVAKYPTDLRMKYKLGTALFELGEYDEAIPVLQAAQQDPRTRVRCQILLGRAFFEKDTPVQAAEVLREALDRYELTDDHSKQLLYWLGRSLEAANNIEEAKDTYGKLLRQDYNYMHGDARKRLENLK